MDVFKMLDIILLMHYKGTYCVEPEFGEGRIVKLKKPFANRNFVDFGAALLFISLSGSCISIRFLQNNSKLSACQLSNLTT